MKGSGAYMRGSADPWTLLVVVVVVALFFTLVAQAHATGVIAWLAGH